jgi:U3 small nucleolar RNA-associated protein 25
VLFGLIGLQANAVYVSEYSRDSEISRGRSRFFHGQKDIMLFSGRAHFFRRFLIRGAKHIIFYSLPEYAHFYPELVNRLGDTHGEGAGGGASSCLVLFTQYEKMALERMVGMKRATHMVSSKKTTFMFC